MKCLKMKVTDVFLFIAKLIAIYSLNVPQVVVFSSQTTTLMDEGFLKRDFDKNCPQFWKIIQDNNLTDLISDCKMSKVKTDAVNKENLQQACIIIKSMMSFMCEKKLNVTLELFKPNEVHFDCPLNFSQLQQQPDFNFNTYELVKKLSKKDECLRICDNSSSFISQCVLLKQLINYIAQSSTKQFEELDRLAAGPKHTKPITQNTENSAVKSKGKLGQVHLEVEGVPASPEHIKATPKNSEKGIVKTTAKLTQKDEGYFEVNRPPVNPEHPKLVSQNTENSNVKIEEKLSVPDEVQPEVVRVPAKPEHTKVSQNTENNIVNKKQENEQYLTESKMKEMSKLKSETTQNKMVGTEGSITKSITKQNTEKITSPPNEEQMHKSEVNPSENEDLITGDQEFKPELEDRNEDFANEGGVGPIEDIVPEKPDWSRSEKTPTSPKEKEIYPEEGFFEAEDSHFFFYFITVSSIVVVCYLAFHNKNKILAYALEGSSGRRSRRRPNRARYRKLETNLEEVISSNNTNSAVSSVVY